jgi:hypothetical protein
MSSISLHHGRLFIIEDLWRMTEAYCMKEKIKREISSPTEVRLKNG